MKDTELMQSWLQVIPAWLKKTDADLEMREIILRSIRYSLAPVARSLPDSPGIYFGPSPLEMEPEDQRLALWINFCPDRAVLAWNANEKELEYVAKVAYSVAGIELVVFIGSDGKWCSERSLNHQGEKFILWSF